MAWGLVQEVNEAMQAALRPEALAKYAIKGTDAEFGALDGQSLPNTGVVSVLTKKLPKADAGMVDRFHGWTEVRKQAGVCTDPVLTECIWRSLLQDIHSAAGSGLSMPNQILKMKLVCS